MVKNIVGIVGELLTRGSERVDVNVVYPQINLDLTLRDNLILSG